jgi:hypothetical protein
MDNYSENIDKLERIEKRAGRRVLWISILAGLVAAYIVSRGMTIEGLTGFLVLLFLAILIISEILTIKNCETRIELNQALSKLHLLISRK